MKNIITISKFTFLEVYRSKIMISLLLMAFVLILMSFIASEFAYGAPAKVSLDVGIGIMSLSNLIMAIFIGSTLLTKEIEQRTLYMILSRPVSRGSFIAGKVLGLSSILFLNSLVLGGISVLLFHYHGGSYNNLFLWTIYFSFLEAFTILLFAVLFSLVTNTTLSVIFTIGIFIVGHAINETSKIVFVKISPLLSTFLDFCFFIIPNLYKLNLKDFLIYQQTVSNQYLVYTQLYIALYLAALLLFIVFIFKNKNLD